MSAVIEVRRLVKRYGRTRALDGLDLHVERGQVHGFLGPNGAGKSTTIRILLGLARPTSGEARLWGADPLRDATTLHRRIASVPGDVALWPSLTGGETIDLLGGLRGGLDERRRAALLERFDLDPTKRAGTYSKGNRQKVALVAAFAADVDLLILDEPTSGLDPLVEAVFRECVAEAAREGRTVLLSSHILGEVDELCDWVSIVRAGTTVETGRLEDLRHLGGTRIEADLTAPLDRATLPDGLTDVRVEGAHLSCAVDRAHLSQLLATLGDVGVRDLRSAPPTLEELFMRHYRDAGKLVESR